MSLFGGAHKCDSVKCAGTASLFTHDYHSLKLCCTPEIFPACKSEMK